ncbi:MAG: replicative DNA helicase [Armatimonadota bacterium]|nr:MAG: replicative DNA helicase [Armatimonadota bacterium]
MSDLLRALPHNLDAEIATLGSMMIDGTAIERVSEFLAPDDFYREAHRVIYDALIALSSRNEPVDLVTLSEELQRRGKLEEVGGIAYLTTLLDSVPSAANVDYYAEIVEEYAIRRRLIEAAQEIIRLAAVSDNEEEPLTINHITDMAESAIYRVARRRLRKGFESIRPLLSEVFDRFDAFYHERKLVTGLSTGFRELDYITAGLQKSDLVIIAARPSMGKTSLCLNIGEHVALHEGKTVAIFSLEMSKEQLVQRMICSQAEVNAHRLRLGMLPDTAWQRLAKAVQDLWNAKIFIDDTPDISVLEMRAKCRRLRAEHDLDLVIVDYLQLMRSHRRSENRTQEISDIARALKGLAREMDVPIIALSQLSRAVEHRENKRPMLSDLRESGSIEAEADVVAFIYRPEYYAMKDAVSSEEVEGGTMPREEGRIEEAEIIIAKQRNGPTGTVRVGFKPDYARFVPLERHREE